MVSTVIDMGNKFQAEAEDRPTMTAISSFFVPLPSKPQDKTLRKVGVVTLEPAHIKLLTTMCTVAPRPVLIEGRASCVVVLRPSTPVVHPRAFPISGLSIELKAPSLFFRIPW